MAAGLGFKTFTTGEVLTAADTNGYLMQGVLVFASSAARAAAITSPQEGQYSYLKDTNSTEYYDGAAWIAAPIGDITGVTAGTGISGGGTSGTVTITNSMATEITAKADLIVGTGSATFDNLTVGANGTVLTADSTVSPTGLKWATPAAGSSGITLIQRSSFSNVAGTSTTFGSVFSSTYANYTIMIESIYAATAADDLQLQGVYSGTTQAASYYGSSLMYPYTGTTLTITGSNNASQLTLSPETGASGSATSGFFTYNDAGSGSFFNVQGAVNANQASNQPMVFGGGTVATRTYTGFILKTSSSNVTGTVSVYGWAKS